MFGSLGAPELLILLGIVVLLFGARKLPELGSSVGKSIKNFKRGLADASAEDEDAEEAGDDSVRSKQS